MIQGIKKVDETQRKKRDRAVKIQDELRAKGGVWNGGAKVRKERDRRRAGETPTSSPSLVRGKVG